MKRALPGLPRGTRKGFSKVAIVSLLLTLALPGVALAHVTLSPWEVQPGATETFTAVVPTEKDVPTTGVSLEIPEGFEVTDVRSPAGGWRGMVEGGSVAWSGGKIGSGGMEITSPEGEVIPMGESQEFSFRARAPENPGSYAWPASQTYEDGSVVAWSGPADSAEPAPAVQVAATGPEGTTQGGGHNHGSHDHGGGRENAPAENAPAENAPAETGGGPVSSYALVGVGVLVTCAATAGVAALRGRGRS